MRDDLGIRVAGEGDAGLLEFGFQFRIVLDNPVVDHGDLPGLVGVWVGVAVVRWAVSAPASVANAVGSGWFGGRHDLRERVELSRFAEDSH